MEDTLAGVKAFFTAELGDELTAIGTERSVTVPVWKLMDTAELVDRQYPSIEILPEEIAYDYGDEEAPFVQPTEHHIVVVTVSQAGSEHRSVQNDLLRYSEAIRRITIADYDYGDRFNWVRLVSANFSEMTEAQEEGDLLQQIIIRLDVRVLRT